jgi:hypothetical protein
MEAQDIIKTIKSIREKSLYRELDESVQGVVTKVDLNEFYQRVMGVVELFDSISETENSEQ